MLMFLFSKTFLCDLSIFMEFFLGHENIQLIIEYPQKNIYEF